MTEKEKLIREYLLYGLSIAEATECANKEIAQKVIFDKFGDAYVKKIQEEAVEYNRRIREQKKLNESQIKFKRNGFLMKQANEKKEPGKGSGRKYNNARPVIDPNGVYYKTTGDMCKAWGTMLPTYCNRLAKGWTMLEALKGKSKNHVA